ADEQPRSVQRADPAAIVVRVRLEIDPDIAKRRQVRGARNRLRAGDEAVVDEEVDLTPVGNVKATGQARLVETPPREARDELAETAQRNDAERPRRHVAAPG